ncbi:MAG: hypothetical protein NTZ68_02755 [Candidatus Dependentiae bacterium]|nr:hypothetical protein [Candidatus Dependentiae bacterium]
MKVLIKVIMISAIGAFVYSAVSNQSSNNLKEQGQQVGMNISANELDNYDHNFTLPINVLEEHKASKSQIYLNVVIPKIFHSIDDSDSLVFIPKTDKGVDTPEESILIKEFFFVSALEFMYARQRFMLMTCPKVSILESKNKEYSNYSESSFMAIYASYNQTSIVAEKYFSGPKSFFVIMYTIAISSSMTEEMAKQKIKDFTTNNIKIVKA